MSAIAIKGLITRQAQERLQDHPNLETIDGHLHYAGHPLITSNSPITGGIFLDMTPREAVYVSIGMPTAFARKAKIEDKARIPLFRFYTKDRLLRTTYDAVQKAFSNNNDDDVQKFVTQLGAENDQVISLEQFIHAGIGTCIHTALTAAATLEWFALRDHWKGKVSVQRVLMLDKPVPEMEGHAFCQYAPTPDPKTWQVVDATLGYVGKIQDAPKDLAWIYRPISEERLSRKTITRSRAP